MGGLNSFCFSRSSRFRLYFKFPIFQNILWTALHYEASLSHLWGLVASFVTFESLSKSPLFSYSRTEGIKGGSPKLIRIPFVSMLNFNSFRVRCTFERMKKNKRKAPQP